jgi:hypothetical protein
MSVMVAGAPVVFAPSAMTMAATMVAVSVFPSIPIPPVIIAVKPPVSPTIVVSVSVTSIFPAVVAVMRAVLPALARLRPPAPVVISPVIVAPPFVVVPLVIRTITSRTPVGFAVNDGRFADVAVVATDAKAEPGAEPAVVR